MSKLAKTARNAMIADVALAFARDRLATKLPGVEPRRKRSRGKLLLIGGAALAGGALLLSKREKVTALLPGRADEPAPPPPEPQASPPISNYDVRGPVENTSTPVPTPAPYQPPAVDEAAEEAAAAAEAANIGGQVSDYAGAELGEPVAEAERPLMEAGEGEAEGQEQTEAELAAAAEPTAPGMSDEERQIEDAIAAAGNPATPERVEPLVSGGERADEAQQRAQEEAPQQDDGSEWRTWSGRAVNP
jgi:hypothetical protein